MWVIDNKTRGLITLTSGGKGGMSGGSGMSGGGKANPGGGGGSKSKTKVASLSDNFESYPVATGIPAGWVEGDGGIAVTWGIISDTPLEGTRSLQSYSSQTGERSLIRTDSDLQNGTLKALLRTHFEPTGHPNRQPGLMARYVDASNYIHALVSSDAGGAIGLRSRAAGVTTSVTVSVPIVIDTTYDARFIFDADKLIMLAYGLDGALVGVGRMKNAGYLATGKIGVRHIGVNATLRYDRLEWSSVIEPLPLVARSLSFNGTNQYGSLASKPELNITTNLTLEADIRPTTNSTNHSILARFGTGGDAYILRLEGGKLRLYCHIGGAWRSAVGATTIPLNVWTKVRGTYDGANLRVFVNGVQDGITAQTGAINTGTAPLRIGANGAGGELFAGNITNARVLSGATEVVNYSTQQPGAGLLLLDHSVNWFDMSLVNSPTWSTLVP